MEKQWYASFEREPVASVKFSILILSVVMSTLLMNASYGQDPAPAPAVTGTLEIRPGEQNGDPASDSGMTESAFLLLPAFDLDFSSVPVKVGDPLNMKVVGVQLPEIENPGRDLHVEAPVLAKASSSDPSSSPSPPMSLQDEGWVLSPSLSSEANTESKADNSNKNGSREVKFVATPLKPGKLVLPSLVLKDAQGHPVARTNPFSVEVASAIKSSDPKPEEPDGLEPPVGLQFPWWIIIGFGILAVVAIAGIVYGIYRSLKKRGALGVKAPEKVLPEDEAALLKLQELERLGLYKKGDFKAHYFKVSEILKTYIGVRYRFDAPESTTQEMITILENKMVANAALIDKLESLFNRMDRVKFTDYVPPHEESARILVEAREFVQITKRPLVAQNSTGVSANASG